MTRVRMDLFISLDGYTPIAGDDSENPMGEDWGRLTAAYAATRTFRERVFGDTSGAGTSGVDDSYAAAFFEGIGAEIMGASMFGLHSFPDDPQWKGWWGDEPPFGTPVYVLTHTAPRPPIPMQGGTTFHFRDGAIEDVLAEASAAADGRTCASAVGTAPHATSCVPAWSTICTSWSLRSSSAGAIDSGTTCKGSSSPTR